jgi:protein SDA1
LDLEAPVRADDIEVHKRMRASKEERLASVMEGREGRGKFGSTRGSDKGGGSTNLAKLKSKPFNMVKSKISKKRRVPKDRRYRAGSKM